MHTALLTRVTKIQISEIQGSDILILVGPSQRQNSAIEKGPAKIKMSGPQTFLRKKGRKNMHVHGPNSFNFAASQVDHEYMPIWAPTGVLYLNRRLKDYQTNGN